MEERNVIDVTSFLLFESIGDSDEASLDSSSSQENVSMDQADDAQSCSDFMYPNDDLPDIDHDDHQEHIIIVDDDDDDDDRDRHVIDDDDDEDQEWSSCEKLQVVQKKSKVCNEYSKMNERDKDRHFWETCLAS